MRTAGNILCCILLLFCSRLLPAQERARSPFRNTDTIAIAEALSKARLWEDSAPDSAASYYRSAARQSIRAGYREGVIRSYNGLGRSQMLQAQYDAALSSFRQALAHCDTQKDGAHMARICANTGNAFNYLARYAEASAWYYRSALLAERYADPGFPPAYAWSNLSTVLAQLRQYDKAIYYTDRALQQAAPGDYKFIANLLLNKGTLFLEKKELDTASRYLDSAIAYTGRHDLPRIRHMALINAANLHMTRKQPGLALKQMLLARKLEASQAVGLSAQTVSLSALGDVYLQLGDYVHAKACFTQAARNTFLLPKERLFLLAKSSELAAQTGDHKEAYGLQQDYHALRDSLQGREVATHVNELETRYRTAEKDRELALQQAGLEQQEQRLARKNLWIGFSACLILFLLVLLAFRQLYQRQQDKLARHNREIERLQARIEGEEQERRRLAQELHDGVNNQLAGARAYLSALGNLFPEISREDYFRKTGQILDQAAAELRRTAHHLLPDIVGRKGLAEAIRDFCSQLNAQDRTQIEFHAYGRFGQQSPELSLNIYRIVQELTGNVLRHAEATEATVLLNEHPEEISLIVEDNGKGMPEQLQSKGIGLLNVQQRVEACKGSLQIEPGNPGTIISIFLPRKAPFSATGNPNLQ